MDYQRNWLEDSGSDDSHGRALLALGTVLSHSNTPSINSMAGWLFEQTLPAILSTTSPRAWSFALIGIYEYSQKFAGDSRAGQVRNELAGRLLTLYQKQSFRKLALVRRYAHILQRCSTPCAFNLWRVYSR